MRGVFAVAVAVMLTLAACSANDNGGAVGGAVAEVHLTPPGQLHPNVPAAIAATGQLRVGAAVGRPPLLFYATGTTTPEGVDADLLQSIGRQLGLKITIVNLPLQQLGPALLKHQIDALASGFVDIKGFEGAGIDFVDYLTGHSEVLVKEGNPAKISGPNDLCGRTVAVVAGTAQQVAGQQLSTTCTGAHHSMITLRLESEHATVMADLINNKVDATLDDSVVANYTAQASTGASTVQAAGATVLPLPYGIGVAHDNPALVNVLQAAMLAVIRDGEYDAALSRWGAESDALRTAPINAGT